MTWLHYIDFEVPGFGELTSVVEAGASTFAQGAAAAWPERGAVGARATAVGTDVCYGTRSFTHSVGAGETIAVGFWARTSGLSGNDAYNVKATAGGSDVLHVLARGSGSNSAYRIYDDAGSTWSANIADAWPERWSHHGFEIKRATSDVAADGFCKWYRDGVLLTSDTGVDNYDLLAASDWVLTLGWWNTAYL